MALETGGVPVEAGRAAAVSEGATAAVGWTAAVMAVVGLAVAATVVAAVATEAVLQRRQKSPLLERRWPGA